MNHIFKGLHKGVVNFTFIIIQWSLTYSAGQDEEIASLQINVTRAKFGEYCWIKACQENQFCDKNFVCQCLPKYKVFNNDCILFAGENEKCTRQEDCNVKLICINGICRQPVFNYEVSILAKVCLGITLTTIIIAIFSSLIKCLIKYDNTRAFQRQSDVSGFNSVCNRNISSSVPIVNEFWEEKPPSYEECIRSTEPPPLAATANPATLTGGNLSVQQIDLSSINRHIETPLNIQNLNFKKIPKNIHSKINSIKILN